MSITEGVINLFRFVRPDSDAYWEARSLRPGTAAVMWFNPAYNDLSDRDQWRLISRRLPRQRGKALDLGCGIGRLSKRLSHEFQTYLGIDIGAMVQRARELNPSMKGSFRESTVQSFAFPKAEYDLILSLACLSSACTAYELPDILDRISASLTDHGRLIMVEPMHRHRPLARLCRTSANDVIRLAHNRNLALVEYTGVQFWPARLLLAKERLASWRRTTTVGYGIGEAILSIAPRHFSDYKVLVFERTSAATNI